MGTLEGIFPPKSCISLQLEGDRTSFTDTSYGLTLLDRNENIMSIKHSSFRHESGMFKDSLITLLFPRRQTLMDAWKRVITNIAGKGSLEEIHTIIHQVHIFRTSA